MCWEKKQVDNDKSQYEDCNLYFYGYFQNNLYYRFPPMCQQKVHEYIYKTKYIPVD